MIYKKISGGLIEIRKVPKIYSYTLINSNANKNNIYDKLSDMAQLSSPNDIFMFYYGSMSYQDSLNETNLVFHGGYTKNSKILNKKEVAPLPEFALLLNNISANKQLFVFESGEGEYLAQNLLKNLFEESPLSERKRRIITTNGFGQDQSRCNKANGPLVNYLLKVENITNFFKSDFKLYEQMYNNDHLCIEDNEEYIVVYKEEDFRFFNNINLKRSSKKRGSESNRANESSSTKESEIFALVIGTDSYDSSLGSLKNPINDATEISAVLENNFGVKVTQLNNPTKNEIQEVFFNLSNEIEKQDQFIFFIAGHGYFNSISKSGHLALQESKSQTEDKFFNTYYQMSTLKGDLDALKANNILAIFDVCYGASLDLQAKDINLSEHKNLQLDISLDEFIKRQNEKKSRIYIASGKDQVPDEYWKNPRHSPFAAKLLKLMKEKKDFISAGQIYYHMLGNETEPVIRSFNTHETQADFLIEVAK